MLPRMKNRTMWKHRISLPRTANSLIRFANLKRTIREQASYTMETTGFARLDFPSKPSETIMTAIN